MQDLLLALQEEYQLTVLLVTHQLIEITSEGLGLVAFTTSAGTHYFSGPHDESNRGA